MIKLNLDMQKAAEKYEQPHHSQFEGWFALVIEHLQADPQYAAQLQGRDSLTLCVRLVEEAESMRLHTHFKHENRPGSVLAFPFPCPPQVDEDLLGDLVICGSVVLKEASARHRSYADHWTHVFIHGLLHLLGFMHGEGMETLEIILLAKLGIRNPYEYSD